MMMRILPMFYIIILTYFISCEPTSNTISDPKFSICLFNKDENPTSFLLLNSLEEGGQVSAEIKLSRHDIIDREYIQKSGFFYRLSYETQVFSKYEIKGKSLNLIDTVHLRNSYFETVTWKSDDELIAICRERDGAGTSRAHIYEINTNKMRIVNEGKVVLPHASKDFSGLYVGLIDYQDNQLWLAYTFFKSVGKYGYTTSDTSYYATLDYPTLDVKNIQTESRSTYPGGFNLIQSYDFKDEYGDYYFMTNPGIALGNNVNMPTAIFRKRKGERLVDENYMINISETIGNHAYGIWYIGQGKAVVRNEQKDLFTDFSKHHLIYQFEYQLVDLQSGRIEKIPVPLDKGTQKENVWSDGTYIYIAIDDAQDQHRIWKYNFKTKEVSKGLKLPSTVSFIVRLDYLK